MAQLTPAPEPTENTDWVVLGKFGRVHGVHGMIRVNTYTEHREGLLSYHPWYRKERHRWVKVDLVKKEVAHQALLVQVKGFEVREEAMKLTNQEIGVPRALLPKLKAGEFYCFELIGMEVYNAQGFHFGRVVDLMETGANDVLVIEGERRYLVPFVQGRTVLNIAQETKRITVEWEEDF